MLPLYSLSHSSGVTAHEGSLDPCEGPATTPSSSESFSSAWGALHDLTLRLAKCRDAQDTMLLSRADHRCIERLLDPIDPHALPADSRNLLETWQHLARCQAAEDDQYRVFTHLEPQSQSELIQLLSDVLAVNCRATRAGWRPVTAHEARDQRNLLRWMNVSGMSLPRPLPGARFHASTELLQRLASGRQLLYQAAGLSTDLCLGSDQAPPRLPDAALLRDLLAPSTRAHVALPADSASVAGLLDLLRLLPVRTWRLQELRSLEAVLQTDPPDVRALDLSPLPAPLSAASMPLLNRAIDPLPNLHLLRLPAGTALDLLPPPWQSHAAEQGVAFVRTDRPDGLTLLDEAVKAWGGAPFSTRMPIARLASHPDAAVLLRWTAQAGRAAAHAPEGAGLAAALLRMLNRAAASPVCLQRLADALRHATPGPDASPAYFTVAMAAAWLSELDLGARSESTGAADLRRMPPDPAWECKERGKDAKASANPPPPSIDAAKAFAKR